MDLHAHLERLHEIERRYGALIAPKLIAAKHMLLEARQHEVDMVEEILQLRDNAPPIKMDPPALWNEPFPISAWMYMIKNEIAAVERQIDIASSKENDHLEIPSTTSSSV